MNIKKAAAKILKEKGRPLNAAEITKLIIEAGFWKSEGKTPENTVSAQIYADIQKKGDKSLFEKVAPGIFALKGTGKIEPVDKPRFKWTRFYEAVADKLLTFRNRRNELIAGIHVIASKVNGLSNLKDQFKDGSSGPLKDICPFTAMGIFNRKITDANRKAIASELASLLGVSEPVPDSFDGIPILNNQQSWFFRFDKKREPDNIDTLWEAFAQAIAFAESDDAEARSAFISAYDNATKHHGVGWNLTMGLYWIRPWNFPTLDSLSRPYIIKKLNIQIGKNGRKGRCNATDYLAVLDTLKARFLEDAYPVHSFPELSYDAWPFKDSGTSAHPNATDPDAQDDEIYKEVDNRSTIKNKENSGTLSKKNNYWIYSPGGGASKWDEFYQQGIMGIGWEKLGDLNQYANQDAISQKMRELGKIENPINDSLVMWEFAKVIQKGDIVFVKKGRREIIGRGVIDSEYKFDAERDEYQHIRKVIWTNKGVWPHPPGRQAPMKALTNLKVEKYANYIRSLEALFKSEDKSEEETALVTYLKKDFLAEVFMEETEYDRLVKLIKTKKNVILQGPPGVGKTFASKRLAYSIMEKIDEKRIMMVQFHQNYSYEDFIMGFRPSKESFELNYGPFYEFCQTAQDDIEQDYFFIIDEINRGNLSKIFGELLMLIENDKRGEKLRLLYKKNAPSSVPSNENELFSVPFNVHLIGLMNTADRSLALIDYALRRRFAFYEMKPAFDSVGFKKIIEKYKDTKFPKLIDAVKDLNDRISKDDNLGDGFRIGHSYFCPGDDIGADEINTWLESVVEFELLPLLSEYWFDEKEKIENWKKNLHEALK